MLDRLINLTRSNSMSHEFYQVLVGDPKMSLYAWKQLARWSIQYSCLSDEDKKSGLGDLEKSWEEFCVRILQDFAGLLERVKEGDDITAAFDDEKAGKMYEREFGLLSSKAGKNGTTNIQN